MDPAGSNHEQSRDLHFSGGSDAYGITHSIQKLSEAHDIDSKTEAWKHLTERFYSAEKNMWDGMCNTDLNVVSLFNFEKLMPLILASLSNGDTTNVALKMRTLAALEKFLDVGGVKFLQASHVAELFSKLSSITIDGGQDEIVVLQKEDIIFSSCLKIIEHNFSFLQVNRRFVTSVLMGRFGWLSEFERSCHCIEVISQADQFSEADATGYVNSEDPFMLYFAMIGTVDPFQLDPRMKLLLNKIVEFGHTAETPQALRAVCPLVRFLVASVTTLPLSSPSSKFVSLICCSTFYPNGLVILKVKFGSMSMKDCLKPLFEIAKVCRMTGDDDLKQFVDYFVDDVFARIGNDEAVTTFKEMAMCLPDSVTSAARRRFMMREVGKLLRINRRGCLLDVPNILVKIDLDDPDHDAEFNRRIRNAFFR